MAKYDSAIRGNLPVMRLNVQLMNRFMEVLVRFKTLESRPEDIVRMDICCDEIVREILVKQRQLEKLLESLKELKRFVEEQESHDDDNSDDDNESNDGDNDDESNDDDDFQNSDEDEGFNDHQGLHDDEGFNEGEVFEQDFSDTGYSESKLDEFVAKNNEIKWLNLRFKVILDSLETSLLQRQ